MESKSTDTQTWSIPEAPTDQEVGRERAAGCRGTTGSPGAPPVLLRSFGETWKQCPRTKRKHVVAAEQYIEKMTTQLTKQYRSTEIF